MTIQQDDWVVHSQHGVGRVDAVEKKELGEGDPRLYFRISIEMGTLWVPVEGSSVELRRLTERKDLARYRALLKSRPTPLVMGYRDLRDELRERLRSGTFRTRCEVVRDLTALMWRKALNESSAVTLKMTRHQVCSEWAAAGGLSIGEAAKEIEALLLEGRRAHEPSV